MCIFITALAQIKACGACREFEAKAHCLPVRRDAEIRLVPIKLGDTTAEKTVPLARGIQAAPGRAVGGVNQTATGQRQHVKTAALAGDCVCGSPAPALGPAADDAVVAVRRFSRAPGIERVTVQRPDRACRAPVAHVLRFGGVLQLQVAGGHHKHRRRVGKADGHCGTVWRKACTHGLLALRVGAFFYQNKPARAHAVQPHKAVAAGRQQTPVTAEVQRLDHFLKTRIGPYLRVTRGLKNPHAAFVVQACGQQIAVGGPGQAVCALFKAGNAAHHAPAAALVDVDATGLVPGKAGLTRGGHQCAVGRHGNPRQGAFGVITHRRTDGLHIGVALEVPNAQRFVCRRRGQPFALGVGGNLPHRTRVVAGVNLQRGLKRRLGCLRRSGCQAKRQQQNDK